MAEPIGFIGLGAMGAPMARRLATLGHEVWVHDLNADAVRSVVDHGARALPSPQAIASKAALVFACLPSLEAIRQTLLADEGLHAGTAIRTFVDFSTTGSHFAREMAAQLRQRGIAGSRCSMRPSPATWSPPGTARWASCAPVRWPRSSTRGP